MIRLIRMHHVNLAISDTSRARDFYCRVLGLKEVPRPKLRSGGIWLSIGENQIHLSLLRHRSATKSTARRDHVAFVVQDLNSVEGELKGEGIAFERLDNEKLGMHQLFVHDPDHNMIELAEYSKAWRPGMEIPK